MVNQRKNSTVSTFASMDVLLLKYHELQIRILTSGKSDIEKINRKKCKIHRDENR